MQLTRDNVGEFIIAITPDGCFADGNQINQTTTIGSIDVVEDGVAVGSAKIPFGEVSPDTIKRLRNSIAWHRR
jgi:hypothetical protein